MGERIERADLERIADELCRQYDEIAYAAFMKYFDLNHESDDDATGE